MLKNNQKRFRVFANVGPNVFSFVQLHEVGAMAIIHKKTLKPSGATIVSTLVANISPIIDITEVGNDHNVLDLVS